MGLPLKKPIHIGKNLQTSLLIAENLTWRRFKKKKMHKTDFILQISMSVGRSVKIFFKFYKKNGAPNY